MLVHFVIVAILKVVSVSGGSCPENQTYVYCNAGCPTQYCPVDDNRATIACSPPHPCPSGCACMNNYKRISYDDDRCILASECNPVECTRENEEWNPCPPPCFSDDCGQKGELDEECTQFWSCHPQCTCKKGFKRNNNNFPGLCVPEAECPTFEERS